MIPRDGGNKPSGSLFLGYQKKSFQSDNLTQDLMDRGLKSSDGIGKLYNVEGAFGGPIKKDRIWYLRLGPRLPPRHAAGQHVLRRGRHRDADGGASRGTDVRRRSAEASTASRRASPGRSARRTSCRSTTIVSCKNRGAAMTAGFDPATPASSGLADLHDRLGEVHLDRDQQDPRRGRRLDQLRALQHAVSAGHREDAVLAGVVHDDQQERQRRSGTQWNAGATQPGHVSRSLRGGWIACRT